MSNYHVEPIDQPQALTKEAIKSLGVSEAPTMMASATEFVLEGLHLHQKLNKEIEGGRATYGK